MELADALTIVWDQLDLLRSRESPPPPPAGAAGPSAGPPEPFGGHRCGPRCPHVFADDSGSFVCRLTGVAFGQQIMNGPLDSRLWEAPLREPGAEKRKRSASGPTPVEQMFSTCVQTVVKLLDTSQRRSADEERLKSGLKAGMRVAALRREETPCALRLMYSLFAEVERCGALLVTRKISEAKVTALGTLLAQLYSAIVAPYLRVEKRRPTNQYYAVAMCYLLATRALGERMHVPFLSAHLPEEKSLKRLGLVVSRVTSAKRFLLLAIKHFMARGPGPPPG
jgi:hypothetical protein